MSNKDGSKYIIFCNMCFVVCNPENIKTPESTVLI